MSSERFGGPIPSEQYTYSPGRRGGLEGDRLPEATPTYFEGKDTILCIRGKEVTNCSVWRLGDETVITWGKWRRTPEGELVFSAGVGGVGNVFNYNASLGELSPWVPVLIGRYPTTRYIRPHTSTMIKTVAGEKTTVLAILELRATALKVPTPESLALSIDKKGLGKIALELGLPEEFVRYYAYAGRKRGPIWLSEISKAGSLPPSCRSYIIEVVTPLPSCELILKVTDPQCTNNPWETLSEIRVYTPTPR